MNRTAPETGLSVRVAVPAEYPAVAALTVAAYRADGQLDGQHGEHGYERALADVADRAGAGEVLVAVEPGTGRVVGSVLFVLAGTAYSELSGEGEGEFRMLAVDPAWQGTGVGAALVRACLERAGTLGCHSVVICVRDFAEPAQRLYARFGFRRTPERDWSPMPNVRLLALRLDLPVTSA